jgi:hypothetical protein
MRNLLGAIAAALALWAAIELLSTGCEARWEGLTASYSVLAGCMVEVDNLKVPEGSIRMPADRPRIYPNWVR